MSQQINNKFFLFETLPTGYSEFEFQGEFKIAGLTLENILEAKKNNKLINYRWFYYCLHCNGWIEGYPRKNLEISDNREGRVSSCLRCGKEMFFAKKISKRELIAT